MRVELSSLFWSTQWVLYNVYIVNLVFVSADITRKSMKFYAESRFGENQETVDTYLVNCYVIPHDSQAN